ncbi:MAG: ABC transporter permease [Candidatus Omnitrophota bacterium]|nr:ABC transporter permease [Candidatus Omnitrophota bacterium]
MNLRRINSIARKEFLQIIRDPRSLILAIFIPFILSLIFGYALNLDIEDVATVIWDQDGSHMSREFLFNFKNSAYFKIIAYTDNYRDIRKMIDRGDVMLALVIPKDFSHYFDTGKPAPVQLIVDGSDSNTATIAAGYVNSVVANYNANLLKRALSGKVTINPVAVNLKARPWFNPNFESRLFIIPGLIAVIMMIIASLLTSLTIAREWERGTMEQLIATPVKAFELVAGKFVPYYVIGIVDLIMGILIGKFLFDVPLRGSLVLLFLLSSLFLTGALAQGITISAIAKNQLLASQVASLLTFMPAMLLSGFMFEIFNMPRAIQAVTYLIPARYFIVILRGIYLKDVGMRILWPETVALCIFTTLAVMLAVRKFKKKII